MGAAPSTTPSPAPTGLDSQPTTPNGDDWQAVERTSSCTNMQAVTVRQPAGPVVLYAMGRVAGTAWAALQLCHRYVVVPAAMWALRTVKAYIEEQLAIQRAMARPCPVPKYSEAEIREATGDLGFMRRVVGTPYGMLVYLTRLRGKDVIIRQMPLTRVADVAAFWAEASAGRALMSAGRHPCVMSYLGCCPGVACHVYEQCLCSCSLRSALLPASPYSRALGGWKARLALCQQLVAAVAHLARSGVTASDISTTNIVVQLGSAEDPGSGAVGGGAVLQAWLAPGCGFQVPVAPPDASQQRTQPPAAQHGGASPADPGQQEMEAGRAGGRWAVMAQGLGQVLMQVLGGVSPTILAPSSVLRALADVAPGRLLSSSVTPVVTDDQAWPLLAAVYPLLAWGDVMATEAGGAGLVARLHTSRPGQSPGAPAAQVPRASDSGDEALMLQAHLTREVLPALAELQRQLQSVVEARGSLAATPAPDEAFAGASAPPLPAHLQAPGGANGQGEATPFVWPAPPSALGALDKVACASAAAPPLPAEVPPEELLCPITHELMDDPVVAADGHSYERAAVERWLAGKPGCPTSPLTGAALPHASLTPNYALRKIISDWRAAHK